jgi:hypothetical protein
VFEILKNIAAPFAAMIVGLGAWIYAMSQGYIVPEEAQLAIWLMPPALAGVTAWRQSNRGGLID